AAALGGRGQVDRDAFPAIWDAWNNRSPEAQAADSLTWDEEYVRRLEQLTDEDLDSISLEFFGRRLDAAGLVRMRLGEHAVHVWDVPVSTTEPDGDYLLTVADPVTLSEWVPGTEVVGELRLPAEALLRLLYGRLDPDHTPPHSAEGIGLDRLRRVFPGF